MIYILARNENQAIEYTVRNGITNWTYVKGAKTIRGLEGKTLICLTGWDKRMCFLQFLMMNRTLDKFKEHNIILYRS